MSIELDAAKRRAELPEHLRNRPKDDPERMRYEKGWKAGQITWLAPDEQEVKLFQKPKKPILYLFLAVFFGLCIAGFFGLQYYVDTAQALQHEIKETLASKGYYRNDPVVMAQFEAMERIILLSKLREMLSFAQSLPPKEMMGSDEFTPLNSYLAYIKANNLPFETRAAIKWMVKQYR